MWLFKNSKKDDVLKGRTIAYLAEKQLFIRREYLSQILSGKRGCSYRLAQDIISLIGKDIKMEMYFYERGD